MKFVKIYTPETKLTSARSIHTCTDRCLSKSIMLEISSLNERRANKHIIVFILFYELQITGDQL